MLPASRCHRPWHGLHLRQTAKCGQQTHIYYSVFVCWLCFIYTVALVLVFSTANTYLCCCTYFCTVFNTYLLLEICSQHRRYISTQRYIFSVLNLNTYIEMCVHGTTNTCRALVCVSILWNYVSWSWDKLCNTGWLIPNARDVFAALHLHTRCSVLKWQQRVCHTSQEILIAHS